MQVIEAMLLAMTGHPKHRPLHPAIEYALRQFRHAPNVATVVGVSRQVGLSRRWLAQTFNQQIGMTPKRYCRLMRFRSIVRHIASDGTVDWAATAVAGGYYDQAHLAHEFRQFSGMTPSSYLLLNVRIRITFASSERRRPRIGSHFYKTNARHRSTLTAFGETPWLDRQEAYLKTLRELYLA